MAKIQEIEKKRLNGEFMVPFDRSSVCSADDTAPHDRWLTFKRDMLISEYLRQGQVSQELASIVGKAGVWIIELRQDETGPAPDFLPLGTYKATPIAVVAEKWLEAKLLVPDFPVSQIGRGLLFAVYETPRSPDPEALYQHLKALPVSPVIRKGTPWLNATRQSEPSYIPPRDVGE